MTRTTPARALRLGVAGPVGTGKSSLIALLCRELSASLRIGVITNDIYTDEDARFLRSAGVLDPERIRAVETGACPHTAIRDDVTANLLAVEVSGWFTRGCARFHRRGSAEPSDRGRPARGRRCGTAPASPAASR